MVHSKPATGRHFGMEVSDEYILENEIQNMCFHCRTNTAKN